MGPNRATGLTTTPSARSPAKTKEVDSDKLPISNTDTEHLALYLHMALPKDVRFPQCFSVYAFTGKHS